MDIQRDLIVGQGKTFRYRYFQILSRGQAPDFDLNGGEPNSRPSIVTKEVAYAAFVLENWLLHYDGRQTMRNYILAVVPASSLDLRGGLRADNPAINYGPLTSKIDDIARKTPWISHIVLSSIKLQLLNSNFEVLASYSQPRDPARAGPMKRLSRFLFGGRPQPECEIILKPLRSRSWL